MIDETYCNTCNIHYKNNEYYKRHFNTIRHVNRSSATSDAPIFRCICERGYSHNQSLYVHRKKCETYQKSKISSGNTNVKPMVASIQHKLVVCEIERISQRDMIETMQQKLDLGEEQRKRQNAIIQTMQQKLDACQTHEPHSDIALPPPQLKLQQNIKSRDKRKKINKYTRKQIADQQQNACGECKLPLTPYFQIDHIIGLQFGGTNDESNLMALCLECHATKSIKENQRRTRIKDAIQTILKGE